MARLSKTRKLLELQEELHILDRDIHHVETRQYVLPATAGGLLALPDLANPAWSQRQALQPQAALTGAHQQSVIVGEITEEHGSPAASRDVQRAILNGYSAGTLSSIFKARVWEFPADLLRLRSFIELYVHPSFVDST